MATQNSAQVPAANGTGVPQGTPAAAAGSGNGTPSTGAGNAPQTLAQLEAMVNKLNTDLRQMKSANDRRAAEREAYWQQREAQYQAALDEARTRGMTEEQKRQYEASVFQRREQELAQREAAFQQREQEAQARDAYIQYFVELGVPRAALNLDGSLNDLSDSGWQAAKAMIQQAATSTAAPAAPAAPSSTATATTPTPPDVVTGTSALPQPTTVAALMKARNYETEEDLWKAFEDGEISADVMQGITFE